MSETSTNPPILQFTPFSLCRTLDILHKKQVAQNNEPVRYYLQYIIIKLISVQQNVTCIPTVFTVSECLKYPLLCSQAELHPNHTIQEPLAIATVLLFIENNSFENYSLLVF